MLKIGRIASGLGIAVVVLACVPDAASARPRYSKVFQEVYPDRDANGKCAVCHFGEKKQNRNDYGKAVEEALGSKNVEDVEAIKAALKKAEDKLPPRKP